MKFKPLPTQFSVAHNKMQLKWIQRKTNSVGKFKKDSWKLILLCRALKDAYVFICQRKLRQQQAEKNIPAIGIKLVTDVEYSLLTEDATEVYVVMMVKKTRPCHYTSLKNQAGAL